MIFIVIMTQSASIKLVTARCLIPRWGGKKKGIRSKTRQVWNNAKRNFFPSPPPRITSSDFFCLRYTCSVCVCVCVEEGRAPTVEFPLQLPSCPFPSICCQTGTCSAKRYLERPRFLLSVSYRLSCFPGIVSTDFLTKTVQQSLGNPFISVNELS